MKKIIRNTAVSIGAAFCLASGAAAQSPASPAADTVKPAETPILELKNPADWQSIDYFGAASLCLLAGTSFFALGRKRLSRAFVVGTMAATGIGMKSCIHENHVRKAADIAAHTSYFYETTADGVYAYRVVYDDTTRIYKNESDTAKSGALDIRYDGEKIVETFDFMSYHYPQYVVPVDTTKKAAVFGRQDKAGFYIGQTVDGKDTVLCADNSLLGKSHLLKARTEGDKVYAYVERKDSLKLQKLQAREARRIRDVRQRPR